MNYKEAVKISMEELAKDEKRVFIGYNISFGSKAYGTLADIPESKKIETPVAENLMMGLGIGMALEGYKPVIFFERQDFILIALDAIVNHLDKLKIMSHGQFNAPVIIRAIVGSKSPLDPGLQHIQNHTEALKKMIKTIKIFEPKTPKEVLESYEVAKKINEPVIIVEEKDLYNIRDTNVLHNNLSFSLNCR